MSAAAQELSEAQAELSQVKEWLLRPGAETVAACVPAIERAVACVRNLADHTGLKLPSAGMADRLGGLAREIQTIQILLVAAGNLYMGRMRRCGGEGTFENTGEAAKPPGPLSVMG
jgi:hypothetical protein